MSFDDKMWKTSKSKMNMESRLKKYDFYSQGLIVYYSLWLIGLTIYDMDKGDIDMSIPTLILSIVILVLSVYIYAMNFGIRAVKTKQAYVQIQRILSRTGRYKDTKNLEEEYYHILDYSENHNNCDFLQVLYEVRNKEDNDKLNGKFTYNKYLKFVICKIVFYFSIIILLLLPIIGIFYETISDF